MIKLESTFKRSRDVMILSIRSCRRERRGTLFARQRIKLERKRHGLIAYTPGLDYKTPPRISDGVRVTSN